MESFSIAEAKARLAEIIDRVLEGEEVLLTRRGEPVARVLPVQRQLNILGAGLSDPGINREALDRDDWWKAMPDEEAKAWYE